MVVYNIRKKKYAKTLQASGIANRWNMQDDFVLYTSKNRSLAMLELLAHRSSIAFDDDFVIMNIELKIRTSDIYIITPTQLPKHWKRIDAFTHLQKVGHAWYHDKKYLCMEVPSVLVPQEYNIIINTQHPHFAKSVLLSKTEPFIWDTRLYE